MEDLVFVGHISSTHRLLGTLKIVSSFYLLEEIISKNIVLKKNGDIKLFKVTDVKNFNGKRALLELDNIKSIDEAKKILGYDIYIHKNLIPEYEEEENFIDYSVYDKGKYIGKILDIMETAAHEILVIKGEKEILVPFIDVFVESIDDAKREINLNLIEGFL